MPSGRTHTRIELVLLVFLICLAVYARGFLVRRIGRDELVEYGAVFVLSYLLGTFLLSPDMDMANSEPMQNWGLLRWIWRPYSALFKHRGLSHVPILGTLTRIAYLLVTTYVLAAAANVCFDLGWKMSFHDLGRMDWTAGIWALCGLCLPDLFHILTDRMFRSAR